MSLIYKTLFEVKLMHEYLLTREDGIAVFDHVSQSDRLNFLFEENAAGKKSISENISFSFPTAQVAYYESLFIKVLPALHGCKVLVRVKDNVLADGTTVYQPFVKLPADLRIQLLIRQTDNMLSMWSNGKLHRPIDTGYYFSNQTVLAPRTFPYLTAPVLNENLSASYEQGELSVAAGGTLQAFYRSSGIDQWDPVKGSGFVNESDRLLISPRFRYRFNNSDSLLSANFSLKRASGEILKSIQTGPAVAPLTTCWLDFSDVAKTIPHRQGSSINDYLHFLEVSAEGISRSHPLLFAENFPKPDEWAMVDISLHPDNPAFNLLDSAGLIHRRRTAMGNWTAASVFELPVKSRFLYWRFVNANGRELAISPALNDYVDKEGNALVTKRPQTLTKYWFQLRKAGSTDSTYVPNPIFPELMPDSQGRFFCNIAVPQSTLFPVAP